MKHLFFCFLFVCPGMVSAQYFNIFPTISTPDSSGSYHYTISGVESFADSVTMSLNAELLTNDELLTPVASVLYDLSDTATFTGLTFDIPNDGFTIDLGNHPSGDYILHMWIGIAGERYDEIYYQQP